MTGIFETRQVSANHYMIGERMNPHFILCMGLVIGDDEAALIDTGMGTDASLYDIVSRLTDKPVRCLITHCDPDHVGAASLFKRVYINPAEDPQLVLPRILDTEARMEFVSRYGQYPDDLMSHIRQNIVSEPVTHYRVVNDGDVFSLGGRDLLAVSLPGHTIGSMCYIDRSNRIAFTGDTITRSPLVFFERCPPLREYLAALKRFKEIADGPLDLYCGHSMEALPPGTLDDLIRGCGEILEDGGVYDKEYSMMIGQFGMRNAMVSVHQCGTVMIRYDMHKL